ncbi:MAG TPA: hypothetical protein VGE43_18495 [Acidimicrobiales bacterium]
MSRRTLVLVTLAMVLVLVGVGCIVGWRMVASRTLDGVSVQLTDSDCQGDGVEVRPRATPTITTTRDMRCVFTITVDNTSGRDVHLGAVRAAVMGARTGSVIRAESIAGESPRGDATAVDAVHDLDRSLRSGGRWEFEIVTVFNPRGCNDGGTLTIYDFPSVEVTALGVHRVVGGSSDLAFHNTIRTRGCRDM